MLRGVGRFPDGGTLTLVLLTRAEVEAIAQAAAEASVAALAKRIGLSPGAPAAARSDTKQPDRLLLLLNEVAELLGVTERTQRRWEVEGVFPPGMIVRLAGGRSVWYVKAKLLRWIEQGCTSEVPASKPRGR